MTRQASLQQFLTSRCLLCGSDDWQRAPFTLNRFGDGMAAIFICRGCGWTPYFTTYPSQHLRLLEDEYYEQGHYSFRRGFDRHRAILVKSLADVECIKPLAGARLLDIGCGEGYLLDLASSLGARVKGIEPNRHQADATRRRNYDVFSGFLQNYDASTGEKWDVVALAWVLDAMSDPLQCLRIARQLLADDGILLVVLGSTFGSPLFARPDERHGGVWPSLQQKPLGIFKPNRQTADIHPIHFTQKTLRAALAVAGFEILHLDSSHGTRLLAKPVNPKLLAELEMDDPTALNRYFIRWKLHDVFIRPAYARFLGSIWSRLPLHIAQFIRRRIWR